MGLYNFVSFIQTIYNTFMPLLNQRNHIYDDITALHYFSFKTFFINIFQMSQTSNVFTEIFYLIVNYDLIVKKKILYVMI